jgi:hypothetical protein
LALLGSGIAYADSKVSALSEDVAPSTSNYLYEVTEPSVASRKVTIGNILSLTTFPPMTIGNPVSGGTPTDVLFVDGSGNLGQNDNFQITPFTPFATQKSLNLIDTVFGLNPLNIFYSGGVYGTSSVPGPMFYMQNNFAFPSSALYFMVGNNAMNSNRFHLDTTYSGIEIQGQDSYDSKGGLYFFVDGVIAEDFYNGQAQFASTIVANNGIQGNSITDTSLASGKCVQTGTGGLLTVTGSACGAGGGGGGSGSTYWEGNGSFVVSATSANVVNPLTISSVGGVPTIGVNSSSVTLYGPAIPVTAISAGNLGATVIASSITLSAMYGAPTLTGTNFTSLPGAQVTSGVPAANIAAGSLGSSVLASSFPVTGVAAGAYTLASITVDAYGRLSAASTGSATGSVAGSTGTVGITLDGGGSAIVAGSTRSVTIPYACTISSWTLISDQSGSLSIHISTSSYANYPTLSNISGAGTSPNLSSAQKNASAPSSWATTTLSQGTIVSFVVDSAATVTWANLVLWLIKS